MKDRVENYQIEEGIIKLYTGREEEIIVPEGIHTIGEGAFKGCVSLIKVVLPAGLKRIMGDAFKGCRKLEEIVFPEGLTYIGSYAFHRCHKLKTVILPFSVEELGDCAFLYCDCLTQIQMPGVKRLGTQAIANNMLLEKLVISPEIEKNCICDVFTGCAKVKEISFAQGESFRMPNVIEAAVGELQVPSLVKLIVQDILRVMELDGRCLVRFRVNIKHVEVPEGIECLAKSCFYDMRGILTVKLPGTLKRIESRAFRNCIGLEKVIFGAEQVQIYEDAFRNCTSLTTVRTADGSEYIFSGLSDIYRTDAGAEMMNFADIPDIVRVVHKQVLGNFRLSGTMLLKYLGAETRVVVPKGITMIAEEAFAGNETIDKVILPESLVEIGAEAFRGCLLMQTINLPEGLRKIGEGAFEDCVKLLRISIPSTIFNLEKRVFRHCRTLQEINLPEQLYEVGESAFYGCGSLKKIRLPENLKFIGKMAFYKSGLREIRLPAKTDYVDSLAFVKSNLQKVWISGGGYKKGKNFGVEVFGHCAGLKTLVLEEGVSHIPDKLAYGCAALEKVSLPRTLESVGRHALEGTAFLEQWKKQQADVRSGRYPESEDFILWSGEHLEGEVHIPKDIRIVAGGAFYGNTKVTQVDLPESVKSIGAAAFKGCKSLRKVFWPSGIRRLEAEVFSGCSALEDVCSTIGDSGLLMWQFIDERGFYRCESLRRLCLEQAFYIGKEAFMGCAHLEECQINIGLDTEENVGLMVGENAFDGTKLGKKNADGLLIVGNLVASGEACEGEVVLPEDIRGIAPYAFAGNCSISAVVLPESLQWIGEGAFFGCSGLLTVAFPKTKVPCRIGAHAFEKCIGLTEVVSPAVQAGKAAFAGCTGLVRAELPRVTILGERLFADCVSLEACFCQNARAIQRYCFSNCTRLQEFDFQNLVVIRDYAFFGCESLKFARFRDAVCLERHGMEDCSGLETICLSGQTGEIHLKEYALSGCTSLKTVVYQGKEWEFGCYGDILSERFPEAVRLLFHSAFSCFEVEQEENLIRYRGAARAVRIPAGIRRIGAEVFRDAMMLEQVEIPESVEYIGARAFHQTAWMEQMRKKSPIVTVKDMLLDASGCVGEVTVPADIRLVCGWAFANGIRIERIRFMSERVRVEEFAFRNCINLREMVLPDNSVVHFAGLEDREKELPPLAKQAVTDSLNCFKTDEEQVLMECTGNISVLRLAHGITAIGEGVFQDGNLLTEITFPDTVKRIGKRAFAGCKWLREVKLAFGVECIEERAFSGCGALQRVELSENLRQIGARAFENCTSLEEIQIPEGVEEIPERAFYRCHSLKKIQLPSTIRRVGKEAFAFCSMLPEIPLPEGTPVEERAFHASENR